MKNVQSIWYFNVKYSSFKLEYLTNNDNISTSIKHYIIIYKRYFLIYFKIKEIELNSGLDANNKILEIAKYFSYLETLLR